MASCVQSSLYGQSTTSAVWTGQGGDTLWSNPANWANNLLPTNDSNASVNFSAVVNRVVTLDQDWDVRLISFASAAGAYEIGSQNDASLGIRIGVTALNPSEQHTINVDIRVLDILNDTPWRVNTTDTQAPSRPLIFNGDIDNNGRDIYMVGRPSDQFHGVISGAGGIITDWFQFAEFYGPNTFTGEVRIERGGLTLAGNEGGFLGTEKIVVTDNNTGSVGVLRVGDFDATVANPKRLNNEATLVLANGNIEFRGSDNPATTREEVSTLKIAPGLNRFSALLADNSLHQSEMYFENAPVREAGGFLMVSGRNLGQSGAGTTRLLFGETPELRGGSGGVNETDIAISTFIFNQDTGFTTYGENGIRPLALTEMRENFAGGPLDNVRITNNHTLFGNTTVNALHLVANASTSLDMGGNHLELSSGILLLGRDTVIGGGTIDFGDSTGVIRLTGGPTQVLGLNATLAGTGGLQLTSDSVNNNSVQNHIVLHGSNTYSGDTHLGTVTTISDSNGLGLDGGTIFLHQGGSLLLNGSILLDKDIVSTQLPVSINPDFGYGRYSIGAMNGESIITGGIDFRRSESGSVNRIIAVGDGATLTIQGSITTEDARDLLLLVGEDAFLNLEGEVPENSKIGALTKNGGGEVVFLSNSVTENLSLKGGTLTILNTSMQVDSEISLGGLSFDLNPSHLIVEGPQGLLTVGENLIVPSNGEEGILTIRSGSRVELGENFEGHSASIGHATTTTVLVTDNDSVFTATGRVTIGSGNNGSGAFIVNQGGSADFGNLLQIASWNNSTGRLVVEGADSSVSVASNIYVGGVEDEGTSESGARGDGTLEVRDGATLNASGITIWSTGRLEGSGGTINSGVFNYGVIAFDGPSGVMNISSLSLNSGSRLSFRIGEDSDRISLFALSLWGAAYIDILEEEGAVEGIYTLIDYSENYTTNSYNISLGTLPDGWSANLAHNTNDQTIELHVTFIGESSIDIPDASLEAALRLALDKPVGGIAPSDLAVLTVLDLSGLGIEDISGLEYASNLESLDLRDNDLTTIVQLSELTSLQWLDINGNPLDFSDSELISFLHGLAADGVSIEPLAQSITFLLNEDGIYRSGEQIALIASSSSGLPVVFSISNDSLGFISGGVLTLDPSALGPLIVTASQEGDSLFAAALPVERTIQITAPPAVVFPDTSLEEGIRVALEKPEGDITELDLETLVALNLSGLGISDLSGLEAALNLVNLDVSNNIIGDISLLSELSALASLNLNGNPLDFSDSMLRAFLDDLMASGVVIEPVPQTMTFILDEEAEYIAGQEIILSAVASSGLPVNYTLSDVNFGSVVDDALMLSSGAQGFLTITAIQPGDDLFAAASPVERTIQIAVVVSFPDPVLEEEVRAALAKPEGDITDLDLATLTTLDLSGLGINDLTGLEAAVNLQTLDLSDNNLTDLSPLYALTFLDSLDVNGNPLNFADEDLQNLLNFLSGQGATIVPVSQFITFTMNEEGVYPSGEEIPLNGVANSGLPVIYEVSNVLSASIDDSILTVNEGFNGTLTITATQPGNSWVDAAAPVSRTINVLNLFGAEPIVADTVWSGTDFTVSPPVVIVSHASNDPTLTLTNSAQAGWEGSLILGLLDGERGHLVMNTESMLELEGSGGLGQLGSQQVVSGSIYLGFKEGSHGTVSLVGQGTILETERFMIVGSEGSGHMIIGGGSIVRSHNGVISMWPHVDNLLSSVWVEGAGAEWEMSGPLTVGSANRGRLTIEGGGRVSNETGWVGGFEMGRGEVFLMNSGTTWENRGLLQVGYYNEGVVHVTGGSIVTSKLGLIGGSSNSDGYVLVAHGSSLWEVEDRLDVLVGGELEISSGGHVNVGGATYIGSGGKLHLYNQGRFSTDALYLGGGELLFEPGQLHVDTLISQGITVPFGGILSGSPWIQGDVVNLGWLRPMGGMMEIEGDFSHGGDTIDFIMGGTDSGSEYGSLSVTGTSEINGGILKITLVDDFVPGAGDSFAILHLQSTVNGTFGGYELAELPEGLEWNLDDLYTTGVVTVQVIVPTNTIITEDTLIDDQEWEVTPPLLLISHPENEPTLTLQNGVTSSWTGSVLVGQFAGESGRLEMFQGSQLSVGQGNAVLGYSLGARGEALISGEDSRWTLDGGINIGYYGSGELRIEQGGWLITQNGYLGRFGLADGLLEIDGAGSRWQYSTEAHIGYEGHGEVLVSNGGRVFGAQAFLGNVSEESFGRVTVTGTDSLWSTGGFFIVGSDGEGELIVEDGGRVSSSIGYIAWNQNSTGSVSVRDPGTSWEMSNFIEVGRSGHGTLLVENGALVSNSAASIGRNSGAMGEVEVAGTGSLWSSNGGLSVGLFGEGVLTVRNGGNVLSHQGDIGANEDADGVVVISGVDSLWDTTHWLNYGINVGNWGTGALRIEEGGSVTSGFGFVGRNFSANGTVEISGVGSDWNIINGLVIAGTHYTTPSGATGLMEIRDGGGVFVGGDVRVHGSGLLKLETGGTLHSRDLSFASGAFEYAGGELQVGGTVIGTLSIPEGGVTKLGEEVTGALTVEGRLDVTQPLSVGGDLQQVASGEIHFLLSDDPVPTITVGGNTQLNGSLHIAFSSDFTPQDGAVFQLFDFVGPSSGDFTDIQLPDLPGDLIWLTDQIAAEGVITIGLPYDPEIEFADSNLEDFFIDLFSLSSGPVTRSLLLELQDLDLSGLGLTNLVGLEYAANLRNLDLRDNQLTDVGPLLAFSHLETLDLNGNLFNFVDPQIIADLQQLLGNGVDLALIEQTLTLSFNSSVSRTAGTLVFLGGAASSGLPVAYTLSDPTFGTIHGNRIQLNENVSGELLITISQEGDDLFAPATPLSRTLTVVPPIPVITSPSTYSGQQNEPFLYLITATQSPYSYAASGLPADLSLNSQSGQISGVPKVHGTYSVTVSATNDGGTRYLNLTLNIAPPVPPPAILEPSFVVATSFEPFSFSLSASGQPGDYEILDPPEWISVNNEGAIEGVAPAAGNYQISIRASNQSGPGDWATISMQVEPNPLAPSLSGATEIRGRRSVALTYNLAPSQSATSFAITGGSLPPGLSLDTTTGVISGVPTQTGIYQPRIQASNDFGPGHSAVYRFVIDPPPQVPVISSTPSLTAALGVEFDVTLQATFAPDSYTFSNLPDWLVQQGTGGQLAGTPTVAGSFLFSAYATNADGDDGPVQNFVIHVEPSALAPQIIISEDGWLAFQGLSFSEEIISNQPMSSLVVDNLPPGMELNEETFFLEGVPIEVGIRDIVLQAGNEHGLGLPQVVSFRVLATPDTPRILGSMTEHARGQMAFTYQIQADSELPIQGFAATGLPQGLQVNSATGLISGSPLQLGTFSVKLSAWNAVGVGETRTMTLTVLAGETVPRITSTPYLEVGFGAPVHYQITATNGPIQGFEALNLPNGLVLNAATGTITGSVTTPDTHEISLRATNINGAGPSQTLRLVVRPEAGAPIVLVPNLILFYTSQPFALEVQAEGMPAEKPWPAGTGIYAENLPSGMSINPATGVISGTPTNMGGWNNTTVRLHAVNNGVQGRTVSFILRSFSAGGNRPVLTGPKQLNAVAGQNLVFTIRADRPASRWEFRVFHSNFLSGDYQVQGSPHYTWPSSRLPLPGQHPYSIAANDGDWNYGVLSGLPLRVSPAPGAPSITSSEFLTGRVGEPISVALEATGSPNRFDADFSASFWPSGVNFTAETGVFSGTPTTPGSYSFLARARNANGWSLPRFTTLVILPALEPEPLSGGEEEEMFFFSSSSFDGASTFTMGTLSGDESEPYEEESSPAEIGGQVGTLLNYTPDYPSGSDFFIARDLPSGLVLNQSTGEIVGIPEQPGIFRGFVRPFGTFGIGAELEIVFTIVPVEGTPTMADDLVYSGVAGQPMDIHLVADPEPSGYNLQSLLDFLEANSFTGHLFGTPHVPGEFEFMVSAYNEMGEGMPVTVTVQVAAAEGSPVLDIESPMPIYEVGVPMSLQLVSTPQADFYDGTSLPFGLSLDSETGLISGTPLVAGEETVSLWGINEYGQGEAMPIVFNIQSVEGVPHILTDDLIRVWGPDPIAVQFDADPAATDFTLAEVPDGFSFHSGSGLLTSNHQEGEWILLVSASNEQGQGPIKEILLQSFANHADYWREENLGDLPTEMTAWNVSAMGDDIPNLMRYAFGMSFEHQDRERLPQLSLMIDEDTGDTYPTLTIQKNPEAVGVTFLPEVSLSLLDGSWLSGADAIEWLHEDEESITVRSRTSLVDAPGQFMRVRVEMNP